MPHIHAELMMEYAKDAMKHDKPWKLWQAAIPDSGWIDLAGPIAFHSEQQYRRKPKTININGFEVPEPAREPLLFGQTYFTLFGISDCVKREWEGATIDVSRLKLGLIHLTAEAAEIHAKALLSFTQTD